ncbi:MAG: hypothetical protein H7339_06060 [Arcicella sp.]|nr:hypothetical protein [Arcicella sp.]
MKKSIFIAAITLFFAISTFAKPVNIQSNIVISKVIVADSTEFNEYYGSYKMIDNQFVEKMKVFFKAGNLYGQATGYPETKLTRKKEDEFEETNFGAMITFTRVDGKINGIKVSVQGQDLLGSKE